jgi:hypothetical protein
MVQLDLLVQLQGYHRHHQQQFGIYLVLNALIVEF